MKLQLHNIQDGVTVLGPGVRYGLWVQGCLRRCPGCMTPQSQPREGGKWMETAQVAQDIVRSGRTGLTISGGEPFLQAEALCEVIEQVRREQDMGVIIYTGNTLAELQASHDPWVQALLAQCDLLVDGAYIEALNDGKNLPRLLQPERHPSDRPLSGLGGAVRFGAGEGGVLLEGRRHQHGGRAHKGRAGTVCTHILLNVGRI